MLDVTDAFIEWVEEYEIRSVEKRTVNFQSDWVFHSRNQELYIQPAEKEKLNPEKVDWSKEYILIFSEDDLPISEQVKYKDKWFSVIDRERWSDHTEAVAEEWSEN